MVKVVTEPEKDARVFCSAEYSAAAEVSDSPVAKKRLTNRSAIFFKRMQPPRSISSNDGPVA